MPKNISHSKSPPLKPANPMSNGKVALITGGAGGIGRAIALQLAKDGYSIAIADLANKKETAEFTVSEIKYLGVKALFIPADTSKKEDITKAVDLAYEELGSFDVMVNNAELCIACSILDVTPEMYRRVFDTNVAGVLYGIQAAAKKLIALKKKGRIISACSVAGQEGQLLHSLYSGSKFAVKGITQAASKELGPHGINVNAYCPGLTLEDVGAVAQGVAGLEIGEVPKGSLKHSSLGRSGTPQDIALLVSYLASSRSDYITGQSIVIDGGSTYP